MYQIRPRWMISPMFRRGAIFFVLVLVVTMMVATSSGAEEGSEEPCECRRISPSSWPVPVVLGWAVRSRLHRRRQHATHGRFHGRRGVIGLPHGVLVTARQSSPGPIPNASAVGKRALVAAW